MTIRGDPPASTPPPPDIRAGISAPWLTALLALVLGATCLAVFWPATDNDFVAFDDDANIYLNEHLGTLTPARIHWAFTTHDYLHRYMPMGWLTYSAAFSLWGLDPAGYHLGSIVLHAVNAVLLLLVLEALGRRVLPKNGLDPRFRIVAAFLAVAWWALHPMRSEVVAWATCLIYGTGLMLVLLSFAAALAAEAEIARPWRRRLWLGGGGLLYTAALLVYPAAAGALAFVVALDLHRAWATAIDWRGRVATLLRRLGARLPTWIFPAITIIAVEFSITRAAEPPDSGQHDTSVLSRLARVPLMLAYNLAKPWWPIGLSPTNDLLVDAGPLDGRTLASVLFVMAITGWCAWRLHRQHAGSLALWTAFVGVLLPLSGVTQVVQFPGDRYSYYAALPIVAGLYLLMSRQRRFLLVGAPILGILTVAWTPAARSQLAVWHNTETLVQHSLALLEKDSYLQSMLAFRLAQARFDYGGDVAAAHAALREAEQRGWQGDGPWVNFRAQVREQESVVAATGVPPVAWDQRRMGRIFGARGELREALAHFVAALRIAPAFAEARADVEILAPGTFPTSHSPVPP